MRHPSHSRRSDGPIPDGPPPAGPVPAARVRVWEDALRRLHVTVDTTDYEDVRAVRCFPLTGRAPYVSFMDLKGKEAAMVVDPDHLDAASRKVLEHALERMYYTARILEVLEISEIMGISRWRVVTDRGHASFEVVSRERIRYLDDGRFVITDVDGNRFEIPDFAALDPASQARVLSET